MHRHLVLEAIVFSYHNSPPPQTVTLGTSAPRGLQWDADVVGTLAPYWVALALRWVSVGEHLHGAGASPHSAALGAFASQQKQPVGLQLLLKPFSESKSD